MTYIVYAKKPGDTKEINVWSSWDGCADRFLNLQKALRECRKQGYETRIFKSTI